MELLAHAPFHLEATVRLLQRRPTNRIDVWEDGTYLRVLEVDGTHWLCRLQDLGSLDAPRLKLSVTPSAPATVRAELERLLGRMLGFSEPSDFGFPGEAEKSLHPLGVALRGARPPRFPSLFEAFCRIVPYQQLSLDAGGKVAGRLAEAFGHALPLDTGHIWAFPTPASVASAEAARFDGIGLSRTKIATLTEIANQIAQGTLSEPALEGLPTPSALRTLDALPGIGPWSAALVLLRGLGRMDVFPPGDVGALRGLGELLGATTSIESLLERLGDRRGYLYFYALGAQLLKRGLIPPAPT